MRPHRRQPTRPHCPWDSPGKNTGVGCHFLLQCMRVKSESEGAQLCPTLSNLMDCSLPGSSIHGIFQARVLEWWDRNGQTVFLMVEEARHSLITPTFPGREIPWSRAFLLILRCTLCCEGQVGKLKLFLPSWVCVFSGLELFTQTSEKDVLIYWWLSKSMFCGEDDRKFLFAILLIWQILLQ